MPANGTREPSRPGRSGRGERKEHLMGWLPGIRRAARGLRYRSPFASMARRLAALGATIHIGHKASNADRADVVAEPEGVASQSFVDRRLSSG